MKRKRWTETGKGSKGSMFTASNGDEVRAVRMHRTVGGLQKWKLTYHNKHGGQARTRTVYLKNRRELKGAL